MSAGTRCYTTAERKDRHERKAHARTSRFSMAGIAVMRKALGRILGDGVINIVEMSRKADLQV